MSDNATQFEPSKNQMAVLRAFQDEDYDIYVVAACGVAGIDPTRYYRWFNDPAFARWWDEQSQRHMARRLPAVRGAILQSAMDKTCAKGARYNPAAQKLYLEAFDKSYAPRTRQDVEVSGLSWAEMVHKLAEQGQDTP